MRILVYGAGSIGSLYAGLLEASGQDVSILARGRRLADLRKRGLRLENFDTGERTTARIPVIDRLEADDSYDVILVVLPKNHVREVLPSLRENRPTPSVVFFGHNPAGPDEMVRALGRERVLLGFPGAAAVKVNGWTRYLILSAREQPTTIGELDGTRSPRTKALAGALEAAGFPVSICPHMDAWLKTHAAEISPTANALYSAGGDIRRLAGDRHALLLMLRAIREGYGVLSKLGVPVTPKIHRLFNWLPEPLLVLLMRRRLGDPSADVKIGHALGAREEMRALAGEFRELIRASGARTPSIDTRARALEARMERTARGAA